MISLMWMVSQAGSDCSVASLLCPALSVARLSLAQALARMGSATSFVHRRRGSVGITPGVIHGHAASNGQGIREPY